MSTAPAFLLLYADDLAVCDIFTSDRYALSAEQIIEFAERFDPQTFHLNSEAAEGTFFRGLAAIRWHTAAVTMPLLVQSFPLANGMIGAGAEISWSKPTRPGDVLQVTSRIVSINQSKTKPNQAIVVVESVTSSRRDEALQTLTTKVLAFYRTT